MLSSSVSRDRRALISPGVFDLLKAIAVVNILFRHSRGIFYNIGYLQTAESMFRAILFEDYMMILLFTLSGFGFRQTSPIKAAKKQATLLLKPYLYSAVAALFIDACFSFALNSSFHDTVSWIGNRFISYLLCSSDGVTLFGRSFGSVGSIWFLGALFLGWLWLTCIMRYVPEKMWVPFSVTLGVIGTLFRDLTQIALVWSLGESMRAVFYIYLGWHIRKKAILVRNFSRKQAVFFAVFIPAFAALNIIFRIYVDPYTILSVKPVFQIILYFVYHFFGLILISGLMTALMWVGVRVAQYSFPMKSMLCKIGRYSLWIICLHAIENCAPWTKLAYHMIYHDISPFIGVVVFFLMKAAIIFGMFRILRIWNFRKNRRRSSRRTANRDRLK